MALNIEQAKEHLQNFEFKTLFIEELGWNNSKNKSAFPLEIKDGLFYRKAIAELSGATVYEITSEDGIIPDGKVRDEISRTVQKITFEHILIFLDDDNSQTIWRWVKKQDKKNFPREHYFSKGQTGDLFIGKIAGLLVDISEIENDIKISDVAKKIQNALDVETVTKKFFSDYQNQFVGFLELIEGIDDEADRRWYASVILNRLMFIYFLQKKMFLDKGNSNYLSDKLSQSKSELGINKFYNTFLEKLFFEGFAKAESQRDVETNQLIGKIKYLNGGLFLKHKIEIKYSGKIKITDNAFENLFALFNSYSWSLDDTPGGADNEINPDVLGYIFEKYINQKAFGAYYTRTEITEYLCEQTVYKLILDAVNEPEIDELTLKKAGLDKFSKTKHYDNIAELLIHLDSVTCKKLILGNDAIIQNLSLLDPACGSGAFLVAAMKTLINVYAAVLGKIDFLGDKKLTAWKSEIKATHPNINYYIKKQIITNNLYGVDIMEEATEIAKLRLFLALVASAQSVDQLEPLPNIDFNIMSGNSLIGLMRVDENMFNKQSQPKAQKSANKVIQPANLFKPEIVQPSLFAESHAKGYQQLINEKEAAIKSYKNAHELGISDLQELRDSIQESEIQAYVTLNELLEEEFTTLGIKYEEVTWDDQKKKEGKSLKRKVKNEDILSIEPFHWGYEFSEIFRKKDGFDAIITNPPWETFQPNAKEFLMSFNSNISKKKMDIKDFEKEFQELMLDETIKNEWIKYKSNYGHLREYYRNSPQYINQVPVINGKKHGKDVNLYKLFVEQSFNLLKRGGYCGIVIPNGICSDLGSKKLREMLFTQTKLTGVFGFENRKIIFENVDSRFKFVVLTFEKGSDTSDFPGRFMRHDVEELTSFPQHGAMKLTIDFIQKQSPDSLSIMEIKDEIDYLITKKLLKHPSLSDSSADWQLILHREFNMTDDAYLFNKTPTKNRLPLYEGKMIFNFTHTLAEPRYWIDADKGREAILGRRVDNYQTLGYQKFRLAYRSVASNTNERTLISTIIPPSFTGNSLNISENLSYTTQAFCTGILNSFVIDWFIRQQVTTNINMFYINQLPVPRIDRNDRWFKEIIKRACQLICTTEDFSPFWIAVMGNDWSIDLVAIETEQRNRLRAELDGIIARVYGLTEEEFSYILTNFTIVPLGQRQAAYECFKNTPELIANSETYELLQKINNGESQTIEFKSTLRVDLKTNKPEKFIELSVIKTLAAFLNSDGGTLLIGVEDNKNVIGLDADFSSFSKSDKLDEFQKHFDNIISKTIGNRFHHHLKIEFPQIDSKIICSVTIKEKSDEPVYVVNETGQETFYIRRTASTIDLKPSEMQKYIKNHWTH